MSSIAVQMSSPVKVMTGQSARTKLQRKCLELVTKLPALTDEQKAWGRGKMQSLGYYVRRGRGGKKSCVWCQECGQMDEVGYSELYVNILDIKHRCSRCGRELELQEWTMSKDVKHVEHNFNFAIMTVCEDMQVLRVVNVYQYNVMGCDTVENIDDVYSVWLDVKTGKETIVSKPYMRSFYHFRWRMTEGYRIGNHNGGYTYFDCYDTTGIRLFPKMKVHHLLKRNGWKSSIQRKCLVKYEKLWRELLKNPVAEMLAKTEQYDMLANMLRGTIEVSRYLPQIRICNRRKYLIREAPVWCDMVDMLRRFGYDDRSPKYLCPKSVAELHNKLVQKQVRMDKEKELEVIKELEPKYRADKGRFFGVRFDDGKIFVHVCCSVQEIYEEGEKMHHCVYKAGYYEREESLILSARDEQGKRLETVEVNLDEFVVNQSRGVMNKNTSAHGDIVRLVEGNMNLIKKAARRKILTK